METTRYHNINYKNCASHIKNTIKKDDICSIYTTTLEMATKLESIREKGHAVVYILHPKNGNKASKHQAEMTIL